MNRVAGGGSPFAIRQELAMHSDKILPIAFDLKASRNLFLSTSAAFVLDARVDLW
jgi:hypothetical protein